MQSHGLIHQGWKSCKSKVLKNNNFALHVYRFLIRILEEKNIAQDLV